MDYQDGNFDFVHDFMGNGVVEGIVERLLHIPSAIKLDSFTFLELPDSFAAEILQELWL